MAIDPLTPDDQRLRDAAYQIAILDSWVRAMGALPDSPETLYGKWVALSLMMSSRRDYFHMRRGWRVDTSHIAWGCRNLLELSVFAKYVAQSHTNLVRFVEDAGVDELHAATALLKLVEDAPTSEADEKAKQALLANVAAMRSASSFQGKQYLQVMNIAHELGFEDKLFAVHKLCSKQIHPTAQSILQVDREQQDERDAYLIFGINYLIGIMSDLIPMMIQLRKLAGIEPAFYAVHQSPQVLSTYTGCEGALTR
jgi:hypothetical protein